MSDYVFTISDGVFSVDGSFGETLGKDIAENLDLYFPSLEQCLISSAWLEKPNKKKVFSYHSQREGNVLSEFLSDSIRIHIICSLTLIL